MRHVDQQIRADTVGDLAKALEIPRPRIGRAAGDDQLRPHGFSLLRHGIHIDQLVLAPHRVVRGLEPFAGHVDRRAMGEMSAGSEIEAHEGIAGLQQRQEHRLVHLAAGIRLHNWQSPHRTVSWRARSPAFRQRRPIRSRRNSGGPDSLGVFVGHHRALRFQHRAAVDVLGTRSARSRGAAGRVRRGSRPRSPDRHRQAWR